ncbi:ankyrin repeat and LEM domain-containing protein 2 isoform 1-T1 [Rhinophrynus dorsalis]
MDNLLSQLKLLDPDELREEILKAGLNCGPITSTTRFIFEKKLARSLLEQQGVDVLGSLNSSDRKNTSDNEQHCLQHGDSSEDGDFGYSSGLNPPAEEVALIEKSSIAARDDFQSCTPTPKEPSLYYAVCPVYEDSLARNEKVHIYTDKKEALQVVKMLKGSRFKAFSSREAAEKFARGICDYCPSPNKSAVSLSPVKPAPALLRDIAPTSEVEGINKEKANSFKSPRTQDLTAKLRKAVEKGDLTTFSDLIWSNPRYLIGSGDNPTVVQEGCRYNVVHVAAKENQAGICQLLLDTLENPEFMSLMYPDDDELMLKKRIRYIVDLYLNTPDKMGFDTPLHFACKFGNADVVNILCSHPDIIKNPRNKYNQTPEEVICDRSKNKSAELKSKIKEYLKGHFYVPLLRAEDNSSFPVIGAPWSPEQPDFLSQPRFCGSPKDPLLAVKAFAGPMSPSKAEDFRRIWKTPPRDRAGFYHNVRKTDPERGAERVGRELAHELDVPWVEYWDFLGCFIDLSSREGLGKLEEYLSKRETSERIHLGSDHEICNKYKTPSPAGKSKKMCNSISVGAFLDDDEDMSLEELKNRQNAALKHSLLPACSETITVSECIMDTTALTSSSYQNGAKHGLCSPLSNDQILPEDRCRPGLADGMLSPVSNLMAEFEKLSFSELKEIGNEAQIKETSLLRDEHSIAQSLSQVTICEGHEDSLPIEISTRREHSGMLQADQLLSDLSLQDKSLSPGSCAELLPPCASMPESPSKLFVMKTPSKNQNTRAVFLLGGEPSKLDNDVLSAVENVEIDAKQYPSISKWIHSVLSYPSTDRQSWPSPAVPSGRGRSLSISSSSPGGLASSTPGRHSPIPGSPGKYMNTSDYGSPGRYSPAYASHIQLLRIRHFSDHPAM